MVCMVSLSPVVTIVVAIAKLFWWLIPVYICETKQCTRLAHNATLTLVGVLFDAVSSYFVSTVEGELAAQELKGFCGELIPRRLVLSFKKWGMWATTAWVTYEIHQAVTTAPGTGTIMLASLAIIAEGLVSLAEVYNFLRVYRRRLARGGGGPQRRGREAPTNAGSAALASNSKSRSNRNSNINSNSKRVHPHSSTPVRKPSSLHALAG